MPYGDKEKRNQFMREYYQKNRERLKEAMRKRYAEKSDEIKAQRKADIKANPEKWKPYFREWSRAYREKHPDYHRKLCRRRYAYFKNLLLEAYGRKCECCNETIEEFLTLDHINGDGNLERLQFGNRLYAKVAKEGFPKDRYRLLCFNCNWACRGGRTCPHQLQRQAAMPIPDC